MRLLLCEMYANGKGSAMNTLYIIGASLSEPHINVLNASGVCMYVCMYICIRTSYRKFRIR